MPQTSNGANGNPWIEYMRVCAANYRAGHTQHHSDPGEDGRPAKRRVTGKQPESTNDTGKGVSAKAMAPKPVKRRVKGKQAAK